MMTDYARARYVQLREDHGQYTLVLYDQDKAELGHGYRGPTLKRAQQDLRFWVKDKGLHELRT